MVETNEEIEKYNLEVDEYNSEVEKGVKKSKAWIAILSFVLGFFLGSLKWW